MNETISTSVLKVEVEFNGGLSTTYNFKSPKSNLTLAGVSDVFNDMISDEALQYQGQEPIQLKDIYYYNTNKIELE